MQASDFSLFEVIAVPILVADTDGIVFANKAFERLLGYTSTELQQRDLPSLSSQTAVRLDPQYVQKTLDSEQALPAVGVQFLTVNGSTRSVEISASRMEIRGRLFCICTCMDQSDIEHVQTSLFEMGAKLNQIVENTPVAMLVMDADHRVTHWNAAAVQLTGVERSELVGTRKGWRPFYADERPILADLILDGKVSEQGNSFYHGLWKTSSTVKDAYEVENYFPDLAGQSRWLFFTAAPIKDTQGRVAGAIETLQDVTQRRDAEDALRSQQKELEWLVANRTQELREKNRLIEALLENAPIGIVATRDSRLQRCNSTFIEIFELQHTDVVGMPLTQLFRSDEEFSTMRAMADTISSSGRAVTSEGPMRTHSGQIRWMQMIGYPTDPSKPSAGSWWLMLDRTEIKKAQEELELRFAELRETNARLEEAQNQLLQSEKMASIGQLAAGVAHEINNPIGFVSSNVSTLRRYAQNLCDIVQGYQDLAATIKLEIPAELRQLVADADLAFLFEDLPQLLSETEDGLQRVKRIVQDLKDFSRVDHNEWAVADLNAGLDSTLNVVRNEVKYKAEIVKDYGVLPGVRCVAAQINQVFMNLIVNAAQAIQDKGVITLHTRAEGDTVVIRISDDGCGMDDKTLRRIFEPFFTTKPVGKGTGLGLSLAYSIVQKHGGRLEVQSQPGAGTHFTLTLPVNGRPKADATAEPTGEPPASGAGLAAE